MARKNEIKNDSNKISFNQRTNTVMAEVSQDNIKEKVNAVREVVSGRSNNEIVLVLQYYDNDVEKVIQAYLEDGAKEALTEWHYSGTKPIKKKKNKKKTQTPQPQTESPQSPVSVSSESGSATSLLVNGDTKEHMVNGVLDTNGTDVQKSKVIPNGHVSPVLDIAENKSAPNEKETTEIVPHPHVPVTSIESSGSEVKVKVNQNKVKEKSPSPLQQRQHHDNRHRSHSGSHNSADHRIRTSSASSTGADAKPAKKMPHHVLERSTKDLHRQTVSLERLRLVFNDEVDKSYKRIKSVFDEIRNCLNKREEELLGEMNSVRDMGRDTFTMRQGRAADLKVKIDRVERMTESELAELRNEIKHFVSDRKIDEDLGRTTRFVYADDTVKADIAKLGEVIPVKCIYIQRHPSLSSIDSGAPSEPDHIPVSSVQKAVDNAAINENEEKKKGDIPHLDSAQTHEIAELQRRLKHSLTLEGIPVETFPERPVSVPPEETDTQVVTSTARPSTATAGNNRNRRRRGPGRGGGPMNNQDRRERSNAEGGGPNYNRGFIQGADGERIILIGKGTRPQSGPGRPPRGGGRGGARGRDNYRGGSGRGNSNAQLSSGDSKKNEEVAQSENSAVNKIVKGSPRPRNENRNRRERGNSPRKQFNANSQQGGKTATNPAGLEKQKDPTAGSTISSE